MSLTNYRDVGNRGADMHAGFQFEFSCGNCSRVWKSDYKPYRKGQLAGLVHRFAYFLGDRGRMFNVSNAVADAGAARAREAALQEALESAAQRYVECPGCVKVVCADCWDERARLCESCVEKGGRSSNAHAAGPGAAAAAAAGGGMKCSNCGSHMDGGRFCAECGFDVASTHKSCPGCGTLCTRSARFCTDCGHGF